MAQEPDFFVQGSDLLLLVFKTAVEFADQFMGTKNGFLALLPHLLAKEDHLLSKNPLHVGRPIQSIEGRFSQQLLYKVARFHHMLSLGDTLPSRRDIRPIHSGRCFTCSSDLENVCPHERPFI